MTDVTILAVDDRKEDLLTISAILSSPDYTVVTASSGKEALRRILEREYAVILLDVMMPDLDGFEVARIVKQREKSRLTPIIFLTAGGEDVSFIYRGYSLGAVDYLVKPIDPDVLRAKVAIFVELFNKDQRIKQQALALREADQKAKERELAEVLTLSEERYRNLAEAIPQIVWTADADGQLTYVNQRWIEYTGLPIEGAIGTGWMSVLHPRDSAVLGKQWREAIALGRVHELECRLRGHDRKYRWYLCRAVPDRDRNAQVVGWLGTFTDFDDRRRALDAAERAVRTRDEFLSIASHELRTPLMTLDLRLRGIDDLVQSPRANEEDLSKKVRSALRQANRLTTLVDSLLDVSRMTSSDLALRLERVELAQAVRGVVDQFAEAADDAECKVVLHPGSSVVGNWDRGRIEQVLQNLINNAIKYAPKSVIDVIVERRGDNAILEVRDHGIGIAARDLKRIFRQFERAVPSRNYGGLGLGLFIVRQIVSAHGGTVSVASKVGKGTTFTVALPLDMAPAVVATSHALAE